MKFRLVKERRTDCLTEQILNDYYIYVNDDCTRAAGVLRESNDITANKWYWTFVKHYQPPTKKTIRSWEAVLNDKPVVVFIEQASHFEMGADLEPKTQYSLCVWVNDIIYFSQYRSDDKLDYARADHVFNKIKMNYRPLERILLQEDSM